MLRNQISGNFTVKQIEKPAAVLNHPDFKQVAMVVVQHDPAVADVLPVLRQLHAARPALPVVVFTSDFSGANARAFLKAGALDVFALSCTEADVLACLEAYLPGFGLLPAASKDTPGIHANLLLASAATGVLSLVPGLAPAALPSGHTSPPVTVQTARTDTGIDFRFLGFFSVLVHGKRVEFTTQAKMLFAYLAYHAPRAFSRDHLARVFWPDKHESQPESARRSLNVELATIRKALRSQLQVDRDFIVFEKNHYRLDFESVIRSDVATFKQCCQKIQELHRQEQPIPDDQFQAAVKAYGGEFLEDCPMDTMNWVEVERQHLSAVFEQIAELYSAQLFQSGEYWKAMAVCHEILSHDANMEVIHRRLMQCYAQLGMGYKMEAQFKLLCQILKARFQSNPSSETIRVYEGLKLRQTA
jgi:DNA-binding SARP family transcriptional activator